EVPRTGVNRDLHSFPTRRSSDLGRTVRRVPPAVRDRWLVRGDGGFEVVPELRAAVEPRRHNLVLEPPPGEGAFDLVVCRNVLIRSEEHTSELQSLAYLVCRLLLE